MALVLALVGAFFVPQAVGAAPVSQWQADGFDTGRSSWNPAETTQTPTRVAAAALNFRLDLATSGQCESFARPVTSSGRLFTATSNEITGQNQWSGQRLWRYTLPANVQESHKVVGLQVAGGNLVAVTTDCTTMDPLSRVYVLDAATGTSLHAWGSNGVLRFAVTDGVIAFSKYEPDVSTCEAYTLSGTQLWSEGDRRGADWDDCQAWPVVASGGRFFAQTRADGVGDQLSAFRVTDGTLLWSSPFGMAQPVAVSQEGNDLYAVSGTSLLVMDPSTGRVTREIPGRGSEVIAVNAGTIFTACAGTALCATRRSNGASLWTRELGRTGNRIVVAGGVVYYAGRAFRAYQGTRIKNASDGFTVTAVAGGRIYTLDTTGPTAVLRSFK